MTIIGVVAAMTMPVLIQKHEEKVTVARLKKCYSVISQAYNLAMEEEGGPASTWGLSTVPSEHSEDIFLEKLLKQMKYTKLCGYSGNGCFPEMVYKTLQGHNKFDFNTATNRAKAILADGTLIAISTTSNTKGIVIHVDVNGFKGPNVFGKDVFIFDIVNFGISVTPRGTPTVDGEAAFTTKDCLGTIDSGACGAWVIMNENMDYLHCNDLSWNGKTRCK